MKTLNEQAAHLLELYDRRPSPLDSQRRLEEDLLMRYREKFPKSKVRFEAPNRWQKICKVWASSKEEFNAICKTHADAFNAELEVYEKRRQEITVQLTQLAQNFVLEMTQEPHLARTVWDTEYRTQGSARKKYALADVELYQRQLEFHGIRTELREVLGICTCYEVWAWCTEISREIAATWKEGRPFTDDLQWLRDRGVDPRVLVCGG